MTPAEQLIPGRPVRVRQSIRVGEQVWTTDIEGEVVSFVREPTGSWFAHAGLPSADQDAVCPGEAATGPGRLMLDRLILRKSDGELSELVIDELTEIFTTEGTENTEAEISINNGTAARRL